MAAEQQTPGATSSSSSTIDEQPPQTYNRDFLETQLRREFTIEDAVALARTRTARSDIEAPSHHSASVLEQVYSTTTNSNKDTTKIDLPPDGGYGWVCCFCCGLVFFATWGSNSAFGVFLSYYINNDAFPGASRMDFAWITGLIVFTAQLFSPIALMLDKVIGLKPTMSIAVVLHFVGYMLASFATKLWHLYVCQGVIVGSAFSFIFVPACTVLPNWFLKRRGLASGIMCTGTGLGGLFYSLTINAMIQKTGDQRWSLRFLAITTAFIMTIAVVFIKRRNDPKRGRPSVAKVMVALRTMFNPAVFRKWKLWYTTLWFCFTMLGYNMTLFSYSSAATALGLSQHEASVLTALVNTAQAIGRPTMGFVADAWVGRVNYTMILNVIIMTLVFAFWIQARSFAALLVCGILLGLCLGVGNVMNPVLTADAFMPEEFACAWAMLNVCQGVFVLFSEVIALSLEDDSLTNTFTHAEVFAGFMFFAGFLCLIPLREYHVKKALKKMRNEATERADEKGEDTEKLNIEALHYDYLLQKSSYMKRVFYPMKV